MVKQLERVQLQQKVDLVLSEEIVNQIKYLCANIPEVEWSGVLFYSIEGTIRKPEEMKCIIQDILPMDKGSKAYTEYNIDERFVEYLMENPEAMSWKVGHIHSHNTMDTFFSGTDWSELNDNTASHNFYLSLIVNNFMKTTAKVAFRGKAESRTKAIPYNALDESGEIYSIESSEFIVDDEKLYAYDCNIIAPENDIKVSTGFISKVMGIIEKAQKALQMQAQKNFASKQMIVVPKPNQLMRNQTPWVWNEDDKQLEHMDAFGNLEDMDEENTDIENFCIDLFTGGVNPQEAEKLVDILEILQASEVSASELIKEITESYPETFEKHFEDADPNYFIVITEEVIKLLEEFPEHGVRLNPVIESLKSMLSKFIEYEPNTTT